MNRNACIATKAHALASHGRLNIKRARRCNGKVISRVHRCSDHDVTSRRVDCHALRCGHLLVQLNPVTATEHHVCAIHDGIDIQCPIGCSGGEITCGIYP